MNKNYLVTKSNTLITSNYDLSLEEQRIIITLASTVQPTDKDFKPYNFSIREFTQLLGIKDKRKYSKIPKITKELMQKVFEIKQGNDIIQVAWLSSAHYKKGTGTVELEFSPKLKPFMLGLKEFYTSYKLKNVLELKGKYTIRMYEILKSNQYKKIAEIKVQELRTILGINTGSYMVYQNFKNRVILQAQRELKEKTDIYFIFKEIKTGHRVTTIEFHIHTNTNSNSEIAAAADITPEVKTQDVNIKQVQAIFSEEISVSEAKKIHDAANGDIELIKEKYAIVQDIDDCKNVVGAVITAIKEGWTHKKSSNSSNGFKAPRTTFNSYDQRHYDIKKLEKKLLGRDTEEYEK